MNIPNLFRYATSELSQDAFFCWLLDWLNVKNHPMVKPSRDFVERIFNKVSAEVNWDDFSAVRLIQQFHHVDIVAVFEFLSQEKLCLVVEDKVHSQLTGHDQLLRNIKNIHDHAKDWPPLEDVPTNRIYGLFVKIGYDFDIVPPGDYIKFNYQDMRSWLNNLSYSEEYPSEILRDWANYFRREVLDIIDMNEAQIEGDFHKIINGAIADSGAVGLSLDNRKYESKWAQSIFQYAFFKKLFSVKIDQIVDLTEDGGYRTHYLNPEYDRTRKEYLLQGTSYGRSWIQYHFDVLNDEFFYRLDWQAGIWGISLRYYKKSKSSEDLQRMGEVSNILKQLLNDNGINTYPFRRLDSKVETTCILIDPIKSSGLSNFYSIHKDFVQRAFGGNKASKES